MGGTVTSSADRYLVGAIRKEPSMLIRPRGIARGGASLALVALVATGCGGSGSGSPGTPAAQTRASSPASAASAGMPAGSGVASAGAPGSTTGHLGDTLAFTSLGGDEIDVTLVKITDPATVTDPTNAAVDGTRWVGVEMTIVDHEADPTTDSAAADGTASDGNRYGSNTSYHIGGFAGCTPTAGLNQALAPGQSDTFCSGFMVPTGVTVTSVGYSVTGVDIGAPDDLVWTVP